jgi:hypothetical protein
MPVSATLASQEFTQATPSLTHCVMVLSQWGGVQLSPGEFLTAAFSAGPISRFTGDIQWSLEEGAHSQAAAASTSEPPDGP